VRVVTNYPGPSTILSASQSHAPIRNPFSGLLPQAKGLASYQPRPTAWVHDRAHFPAGQRLASSCPPGPVMSTRLSPNHFLPHLPHSSNTSHSSYLSHAPHRFHCLASPPKPREGLPVYSSRPSPNYFLFFGGATFNTHIACHPCTNPLRAAEKQRKNQPPPQIDKQATARPLV
jgi:hypothetical protein